MRPTLDTRAYRDTIPEIATRAKTAMKTNASSDLPTFQVLQGDSLKMLKTLPGEPVDCIVTSPPYWNLRDYGVEGQIGMERRLGAYFRRIHAVFRECQRVLKTTGTAWVNIGDTRPTAGVAAGIRPKNLAGIPWRLALGLQARGWILRQDIIWHKPCPMPESAMDRCTTAHEYIFLLAKSPRYFWNRAGMREPSSSPGRPAHPVYGWDAGGGSHSTTEYNRPGRKRGHIRENTGFASRWDGMSKQEQCGNGHNRRSVWTCASGGAIFGDHRATFPEALVEPMLLAGCPDGGTVLDPFSGSATTGVVALKQFKNYIGIELNPEHAEMSVKRLHAVRDGLTPKLF